MTEFSSLRLAVEAVTENELPIAEQWAARLNLPLCHTHDALDLVLQVTENGLQMLEIAPNAAGAVRVDFVEGAVAHRRRFGGGAGQMIAKAVGVQSGIRPNVLDATAGLGRDAFVLASLGCDVTLVERQPLVAALLEDGLQRAAFDSETAAIVAKMHLIHGNSTEVLLSWLHEPPQVVYLDPMFPHRDKSALVKKEMRVFRPLVGDDLDAPALLDAALALASHRVVVKRPRKAPCIDARKPSFVLEGKSSRYDIYAKKALKPSHA